MYIFVLFQVAHWLLDLAPLASSSSGLILAGSSLAALKLVQIPATDRQVALIVVHALPEVLNVGGAHLWCLVVLVHDRTIVGLSHWRIGRCDRCFRRATAAKEAADHVADG